MDEVKLLGFKTGNFMIEISDFLTNTLSLLVYFFLIITVENINDSFDVFLEIFILLAKFRDISFYTIKVMQLLKDMPELFLAFQILCIN